MSDPSTSANGLTLDITSDDPCIAYSREAYAEVCRLRGENEINRAHAVEHYEWLVKEREETARLRVLNTEQEAMLLNQAKTIKEMQAEIDTLRLARGRYRRLWEDLRRTRSAYEGEK